MTSSSCAVTPCSLAVDVPCVLEQTRHLGLGEAGGGGTKEPLHLHILTRWSGDTDMTTVSSGIQIQPKNLGRTFARPSDALGKHYGGIA